MIGAFFTGLAGPQLLDSERAFLSQSRPAGIILFARNILAPDQVRWIIAEARAAIGHSDCLVLVDQEGGRVQRLRPPFWRELPSARKIARYDNGGAGAVSAIEQVSRLIAADLLTADERAWLDGYHARVAREIGPLVDAATWAWLNQATLPLT